MAEGADAVTDHVHTWQFREHWNGERDQPRTIERWHDWYCATCDTYADEQPDDWIEPPEEEFDERQERFGI